jgi:hypothetical protein
VFEDTLHALVLYFPAGHTLQLVQEVALVILEKVFELEHGQHTVLEVGEH